MESVGKTEVWVRLRQCMQQKFVIMKVNLSGRGKVSIQGFYNVEKARERKKVKEEPDCKM